MSAFKPIDSKRNVLEATSGHQASVVERFDCVGGGGPNYGCEGHIQIQVLWDVYSGVLGRRQGVYQEGEGFVG